MAQLLGPPYNQYHPFQRQTTLPSPTGHTSSSPPLPRPLSLPSFNLYSELTSSLKLSLINPTQF